MNNHYYDLTQKFLGYINIKNKAELIQDQRDQEKTQIKFLTKYTEDILKMIQNALHILKQSKQNYFSNTAYSNKAFTNVQRQQFNNVFKQNIQQIKNKINQVNQMTENNTFKYTSITVQHFKGVVHCLYQKSKKPQYQFKQFLQFSKQLKLKLLKMLELKPVQKKQKHLLPQEQFSPKKQINPELQKQNKLIYMRNSQKRNQILDLQNQLQQITEIIDQMGNKILEQQCQTSAFTQIGEVGLSHIQKANKNLVEAISYNKAIGKNWIYFFYILALILLIFDWIKS